MSALRALAPAKINLGLFLGQRRAADGRHELVSVMQSISLADTLTLGPSAGAPGAATLPGGGDEVVCPGVPGPAHENLAAGALAAFRRRTGWSAPPQRLQIEKRIPVAGGMGGGSADAAAALRLAASASGLADERMLLELARELGADVAAQVRPGRWLASGAGERLAPLAPLCEALAVLVLPLAEELSTAAVYAEADRLGLQRPARELAALALELAAALEDGRALPAERSLLDNDLQRAAVSLCPAIADVLELAQGTGADATLLSGSGPTVLGLFAAPRADAGRAVARAQAAAAQLRGRVPGAAWALAASAGDGAPQAVR